MSKQKKRSLYVCNRVASVRKSSGFTQQELAEFCGSTQNTISAIESGTYEPSGYMMLILASALGVTVEYLFWLDTEPDFL